MSSPERGSTPVRVRWQEIEAPSRYAREVLAAEAADIPRELIENYAWFEQDVALSSLRPDPGMIERHDCEEAHIRRRDGFVELIRAGRPLPPLIALGRELKLVDGYARYRALRLLGIERARVLRQRLDS